VVGGDEEAGAVVEGFYLVVLDVVALDGVAVLDAETEAAGVVLRVADEEGAPRGRRPQQQFFRLPTTRFAEEPPAQLKIIRFN